MSKATLAVLDDQTTVEQLDPHGLLGRIEALPEQCIEGWRRAREVALLSEYGEAREVVLLGMGGSAIAGDVLRALASSGGHKAMRVVRGYDVPSFVDQSTLVVACSHGGNTEETLSAFEQALTRGARTAVITAGGRLRELAESRGVPAFEYQYDGEPRSALGHQLMALLALGERAGLLPAQDEAVAEAIALLQEQRTRLRFDVPAERNTAKQLAGRLHGRLPLVVGAGVLVEAAHRWKTQLNENSKCWAFYDELPELGHNTIVGFGLPDDIVRRLHVLFLWHRALQPRLLLHYEVMEEELAQAGVSHERVEALGQSPLAQVLSAIYVGDFVSYYLALLNGVEPSPVAPIGRLKARLAEVGRP